MALIVLDPCDLGTVSNEEGVVLQVNNIEGFDGIKIMVPINWVSWDKMVENVAKQRVMQGPKIQPASIADMAEEAARRGQ